MSLARFEKPCVAAPARAIERAVRYLLNAGYGLKEQSESAATLVFMRGSATAATLDCQRHELDISSDGKSLHFDYHSGMGSSGYLTKKERNRLEESADQAVAAAREPAPPPPPLDEGQTFRCRYCNSLTPLDKPSCQSCGADNFV